MQITKIIISLLVSFIITDVSLAETESLSESEIVNKISFNIESVCKKPSDAGSFWEAKVKADGSARLKVLLGTELSAGAEFTKRQWDGVVSTIEDSASYRACVEKIAPLFVEKYLPILIKRNDEKKSARKLGGIKLMDFKGGVELTLESCKRKSDTAICSFTANSVSDIEMTIGLSSYLFDEGGNQARASSASIANFFKELQNNYYFTAPLIAGVDTPVVLYYSGLHEGATRISKLTLKSKKVEFVFRDVELTK